MAFLLSYIIQCPGEGLHDMESVHRDLSIGELRLDAAEEGRRHVADHFEYLLWLALMVLQKGLPNSTADSTR